METHRQGDVLFVKISAVPEGFKKTGTVLEIRGEKEGHVHRVERVVLYSNTAIAERPNSVLEQAIAVVELAEARTVTHPDHPDLKIPTGIYEVRQARRYAGSRNRRVD